MEAVMPASQHSKVIENYTHIMVEANHSHSQGGSTHLIIRVEVNQSHLRVAWKQ